MRISPAQEWNIDEWMSMCVRVWPGEAYRIVLVFYCLHTNMHARLHVVCFRENIQEPRRKITSVNPSPIAIKMSAKKTGNQGLVQAQRWIRGPHIHDQYSLRSLQITIRNPNNQTFLSSTIIRYVYCSAEYNTPGFSRDDVRRPSLKFR